MTCIERRIWRRRCRQAFQGPDSRKFPFLQVKLKAIIHVYHQLKQGCFLYFNIQSFSIHTCRMLRSFRSLLAAWPLRRAAAAPCTIDWCLKAFRSRSTQPSKPLRAVKVVCTQSLTLKDIPDADGAQNSLSRNLLVQSASNYQETHGPGLRKRARDSSSS